MESNLDTFSKFARRYCTGSVSEARLIRRLASGRKLVMKFGIDITGPDLHIGHAVNLWLYRALQEAGHKLVLVIGDYTTNVGDPSLGRRIFVPISPDVIAENAESYVRQVRAIVLEDPEVFEIRRNSEWLSGVDRDLLYRLAGGSRDRPLYPLLQGYDSVALRADLTIVGTDQIENERLGRTMQTAAGQAPQSIIASIVTPGLFGGPKQSKSLRNYIKAWRGRLWRPLAFFFGRDESKAAARP